MGSKPRKIAKRWLGIVVVALVVLTLVVARWSRENVHSKLGIGTPGDSAGVLIHYLAKKTAVAEEWPLALTAYSFKDCCTSTGEWALSSEKLKLSVLCPDAAARLVAKDSRYTIVGPCLVNSDIIVVKPGKKPGRIGITQNRWYQRRLVSAWFGPGCQAIPMLPGALPYAYQRGEIDGVVVDVTQGLHLQGKRLPGKVAGIHTVTYVLVVRKDFQRSPEFGTLMQAWEVTARELNEPCALQAAIADYDTSLVRTYKEADEWKTLGIRFLDPLTSRSSLNLK